MYVCIAVVIDVIRITLFHSVTCEMYRFGSGLDEEIKLLFCQLVQCRLILACQDYTYDLSSETTRFSRSTFAASCFSRNKEYVLSYVISKVSYVPCFKYMVTR